MAALPHWVVWREVQRGDRLTKVPFNPLTGQQAKANDPTTWTDYATATTKVNGYYNGIGFQAGDGETGIKMIDLDSCLVDGELAHWAREIVTSARSFTEVSPSGNGLHIFYKGKSRLPAIGAGTMGHDPHAEYYEAGRYFTVTGNGDPQFDFPFRELSEEEEKHIHTLIASTHPAKEKTDPPIGTEQGKIVHPNRHPTLFSLAGAMRRKGCEAREILAALSEINKRCDPMLPEGELRKMACGVQRYEPETDFRATEAFAAEYFVDHFGGGWKYDHSTGRWFKWTGTHWLADSDRSIVNVMTQCAVQMRNLAAEMKDPDAAKAAFKFALSCESKKRCTDVLTLVAARPEIAITSNKFDSDPMIFNCLNGTLHFHGKRVAFKPHDRDDLCTKTANVNYNPAATCPKFDNFISWCCREDMELVDFHAQFFGVSLLGITLQHLFFWYGLGENGKSVLARVMSKILNTYSLKIPVDALLTNEHGDRIPADIAELPGVRLAITSEIPYGKRLNVEMVKTLTGNDTISARFMRQNFFRFDAVFKLLMIGNHRPRIPDQTHAIWRRVLLIPFENQIDAAQRRGFDELVADLLSESAGILNWCLCGLKNYWQHGFQIPEKIRAATAEYEEEEDTLRDFLNENITPANGGKADARELFRRYEKVNSGATSRTFYAMLRERGMEIRNTGGDRKMIDYRLIERTDF
jgi:putative DNA primase/helicase